MSSLLIAGDHSGENSYSADTELSQIAILDFMSFPLAFGKFELKSRHKNTKFTTGVCFQFPLANEEKTTFASQCSFMTRKTKYITGNDTKKRCTIKLPLHK